MKNHHRIAGAGALAIALSLSVALPVSAAPAGPNIAASVNTTCNVSTEKVLVAAFAENRETVPVSVKFETAYGTKSGTVAPGARFYQQIETGKGTVEAGKVTVSLHRAASGATPAAYSQTVQTFPAKTCTLAPTGTAKGGTNRNSTTGNVTLAAYFVNTGRDAVSVRLLTPRGDSAAQTVEPGKPVYLTVPTDGPSTPELTGTVRAYKYIDGKGFQTLFPVTFAAVAAPADTVLSVPGDFTPGLSDTRLTGRYEVTDKGGLRVYTTDSQNPGSRENKVAEYVLTKTDLAKVGTPSLDYTATTGTIPPGYQLMVDFNADGTTDGILVGEKVYGDNWWLNTQAAAFAKDGAPHTGGGFGSPHYGTLAEWSAAFPSAKVAAFGFSLGSGVYSDGVINSITFAGTAYTFED